MAIQIKFVYNDGKDLQVDVQEEKLKFFFDCLNTRGIYWNDEETLGFWTDLDKIRYVQIFNPKKPALEVIHEPKENQESIREICCSDGVHSEGESASS